MNLHAGRPAGARRPRGEGGCGQHPRSPGPCPGSAPAHRPGRLLRICTRCPQTAGCVPGLARCGPEP
ncbi:hypothetical protein AMK10_06365 [Streptomyces sp. CB02058]|nr:hypothetical protein AMK10_06365 [Streptomyces sp. CB02058]